jgi:FHS family L-fucose permease-like MFS transporter
MEGNPRSAGFAAGGKGAPLGFAFLTSLFFAWGFLTCMNDILIPYLKAAFSLSFFEAMMVQFAFFLAYTLGSVVYIVITAVSGDPIARIGYQNGIVLGLFISGIGALLFYPAGAFLSYPLFLGALFILALGFTMLQISANPYVTVLGPESTASSRLNLSQGFNSLGTTLAPLIGGYLVFSGNSAPGVDNVRVPYLVFAVALFALGLVFLVIKLPKLHSNTAKAGLEALRYLHVRYGMLAIFCYVGAEVSVGSLLISYFALPEIAGLSEAKGEYLRGHLLGRADDREVPGGDFPWGYPFRGQKSAVHGLGHGGGAPGDFPGRAYQGQEFWLG